MTGIERPFQLCNYLHTSQICTYTYFMSLLHILVSSLTALSIKKKKKKTKPKKKKTRNGSMRAHSKGRKGAQSLCGNSYNILGF